jgi:hypothetical protein
MYTELTPLYTMWMKRRSSARLLASEHTVIAAAGHAGDSGLRPSIRRAGSAAARRARHGGSKAATAHRAPIQARSFGAALRGGATLLATTARAWQWPGGGAGPRRGNRVFGQSPQFGALLWRRDAAGSALWQPTAHPASSLRGARCAPVR